MKKKDPVFCTCLYYSSAALSRVMTKMAEEEFAAIGISPSHGFLIMAVNTKPGIQPTEIGEQMQLTPSTVTRLIEKMEHKGYLERRILGRGTHVHPSAEGKKLKGKIQRAWTSLNERYTETLGKKGSKDLTSSIYDAVKQLEKHKESTQLN